MEREEGLEADRVCLITILDACACNAALLEGKLVHNRIAEMGLELERIVGTGLVAMYGKCGSLEDARRAFEKLSKPGVASWNAIIGAYAEQGAVERSLGLFSQMREQGCEPDRGTFQNLLSAFRHGGVIEEGIQVFSSMCYGEGRKLLLSLELFNGFADLLARAGLLEKSEGLIESMPCNPSSSSWIALMSACKLHSDAIRGADAAAHALDLDPRSPSPYVLLSNIYAIEQTTVA
jgi:pentatricopeptide repeat protein